MSKIIIDRKYRIFATNPISKSEHTEYDSVLMLARDKAFLLTLPFYIEKLKELKADDNQIKSAELLLERVTVYQKEIMSKVPDMNQDEAKVCCKEVYNGG